MDTALLDLVNKSPEACKNHDKYAWMALFDSHYILEDPVGSSPHMGGVYNGKDKSRGVMPLSRFFDTFIQPNTISFDVHKDIVCDDHVIRDLDITIVMSENIQLTVPMHLLYELRAVGDSYRIARLAAHWQLVPMVTQLLGKGVSCVPIVTALTVRMLRFQGIAGTLGFSKAAFNIGNSGRSMVKTFMQSLNDRDMPGLMNCFCHDEVDVHLPYGVAPISPSMILEHCLFEKIEYEKLIVAGDTVSISFCFDENTSGVALFEFDRRKKKINQLRFYYSV